MSSVRVVYGKDAPQMVRDEEPFFVEKWRDEIGNEYINEYRLVFSFEEGLLVEIAQTNEFGYEFSWEVPLDQLDAESLMRLKDSGRLERIRAKVREVVRRMTENLDSLFFDLKAND